MSAEATLAAAGITGAEADEILALVAAGGIAGAAVSKLIRNNDDMRAAAAFSGEEAAAARTEADASGAEARELGKELERLRDENEFLLFTGLALSVEFRGEAESARSNVNALYSPRSESSDAAPRRPGGTSEGLRLCEVFESRVAEAATATGDASFAGMSEEELALLPDEERAEIERERAAELAALAEADALLASVIGTTNDDAGNGEGQPDGTKRRQRAPSPPLGERFADLEHTFRLALPDGGFDVFATRGEAEAAAAELAASLVGEGLRMMPRLEEHTELRLVPARVVVERVLRPKYRARVRAPSVPEAKAIVAASVGRPSLSHLRVDGLGAGTEAHVDVALDGARWLGATVSTRSCLPRQRQRDVFLSTSAGSALIGGSYVSPSLGAAVLAALAGGTPVWRQLSMPWPFCGANVPPSVAGGWVNRIYDRKLRHLMPHLRDRLLSCEVVHGDETPIRVLRTDRGRSKSYMWLFSTPAGAERSVRLFTYAPDRKGENAATVLGEDFGGWLVTDAYPGYKLLKRARHAFCLIHARRKFWDALCVSTLTRPSDWALACVTVLDGIFDEERKIGRDLPPEERLALRRESMSGLVGTLDRLCAAIGADGRVPKKGKLATAVAYWENNREELTAFLRDGSVSLHNMIAEQMARRVSIYRKNSMFCGSELGADARACLLTLVETARANGLDPYSYLEFVLERTRGDGFWGDAALMESLMPWSREAQAACARAAAVREPSHAPVGTAA